MNPIVVTANHFARLYRNCENRAEKTFFGKIWGSSMFVYFLGAKYKILDCDDLPGMIYCELMDYPTRSDKDFSKTVEKGKVRSVKWDGDGQKVGPKNRSCSKKGYAVTKSSQMDYRQAQIADTREKDNSEISTLLHWSRRFNRQVWLQYQEALEEVEDYEALAEDGSSRWALHLEKATAEACGLLEEMKTFKASAGIVEDEKGSFAVGVVSC